MRYFLRFSLLAFFSCFFGFVMFVNQALADTHIWDGGGANENWSTCANWDVGDTCPTTGDIVTFNATSTKNCTIDASAVASIATFNLNSGYTGTITQARAFAVTGATTFAGAGTFTGSTDALTFFEAYNQSAGIFNAGNQTIIFYSTFTLATATFNGAGTLDFNNAFTLNSGAVFISTSGTAYFARDFTIAEGAGSNAWQHNNGTVVVDGGIIYTWNVDSTNAEADETFNNLQINGNGGLGGINGETLIVTGTLTLTNGYFNTAGAILSAQGAVSVAAAYDGGTGTILVSGSGTNAITMASGFTAFNVFTINNTNATVDFTGSIATTFSNAFTLQAGTFNQDSAPITFSSTFTQSGGIYNGGSATALFSNAFVQSGGTFNGNASTLDFNYDVTLNSGATFISTSGTAYFARSFTIAEGAGSNAWQHNNGTVVFDGTLNYSWDVDSTNAEADETFNNLQINGNGGLGGINSETLIVTGTLTLTNGSFNTAGAILSAQGAVSVAATYDGGTGTILVSGSGTNAITMASGFTAFNVFTINNTNATVDFTGSIATTFSNAFTLQAGTFNQDSAPITFSSTFTQSGGIYNGGSATASFNAAFAQSGGTFNGNASTLDFNSTFTLNTGAIFISTSGAASFANAFTIAEGAGSNAWQHNGGTVVFDSTINRSWNVDSTNAEADETFNNLQINGSGGLDGINGETLIVTGTLTLTNGYFNTAGAILSVQGAVSVAPTYDGGTGTILVSGSGTNAITMASGFTAFNIFTINNVNATVDFTGSTSTTFGQAVTLQAGTFNQDSAPLAFSDTFIQSGGTFNGGSAVVDHNGTFTISGDTAVYNATSGSMTFNNNWTHAGNATFNHNNGTVIFDSGGSYTRTMDINVTETFYNFTASHTVGGGYGLLITAGDTLVVNNLLTLTNGQMNTGTVQANGSVSIASTFDGGTAPLILAGSAVQTFTIAAGAEALFDADITVNKTGGSVNLSGTALTMNTSGQDLIIQQGTFDLNGANLTVSGGGTETIIVNNTGNLQLFGSETVTADSASYPQFDLGSTVTYDGVVGPYTMKDWTMTNATLVINGGASSVFTLGATETIKNVTITSGILSLGASGLTVSTTFSNNGTLRWRGSGTLSLPAMDTDSGTVEFTGDGDTVADTYTVTTLSATYYNLVINSTDGATDIFELGAALDVNNNLTITAGNFDVTASNRAITVGGNFARVGTFTQRTGTVTFDDATKTSIISGSTTFNNFTCTTQDKNFQFTAATTQTISGTLTLTGAASHLIILRSTSTDSYWNLIAGASQAVTYVNVQDSDASGGTQINPGLNSFDAGHNLNWQFQPEVNWTSASQSGAENVGTLTLTASLSYAYASDVTVPYTYATGTATLTSDFTITASPLIITAGNTSGNITITIVDDVIDELSETVIVTMGSPTNGTKGATDVHTATITDNDAAPTLSIDDPTVSEGAGTGTVTVTLTGGSYLGASVNYETSSGTAISGTDFTATSGTLTWAADETGTKTFNITITNDVLDEDDEILTATLSVPVNATISDSIGTFTITDNDAAPTVDWTSASQSSVDETGTMTVTAQLSAVSGLNVTIPYSVDAASTATGGGTDYSITASPITITAGNLSSNITITIVTDTLDENNETVIVNMGSLTNGTQGSTIVHTATIVDDDLPPVVTVTSVSQTKVEDAGTATVTIQLSTPSGKTVTAPYTLTGTAIGGSTDYSVTASPASIAPGDTTAIVTFTITDDAIDENSETAILTLNSPTNASLGADTIHTLTITDNDATPTVDWTVASQSILEDDTSITLTAQLSSASGLLVTVPFSTSGLATGSGVDYSITASPVTISAGSTTTNITITIVEDSIVEPDETIIVTMGTPTNAGQGSATVHTASILRDDLQKGSGTSSPSIVNSVSLSSPIHDEVLIGGSTKTLRWSSAGNTVFVNLSYSFDLGDSYTVIGKNLTNFGSYSWLVPDVSEDNVTMKIEITDLVNVLDIDTATFSIVSDSVVPEEDVPSDEAPDSEVAEQGMAIEATLGERWAEDAENRGISGLSVSFPDSVTIGTLVKLIDDGDPETQLDSAVYYIGADQRRHPFPSENVYKSWFSTFDDINIIDAVSMSQIPIGPLVTFAPYSVLVKFPSVSRVYSVDSLGILHWLTSETEAVNLYGNHWFSLVRDVSEAFWSSYQFGADIGGND